MEEATDQKDVTGMTSELHLTADERQRMRIQKRNQRHLALKGTGNKTSSSTAPAIDKRASHSQIIDSLNHDNLRKLPKASAILQINANAREGGRGDVDHSDPYKNQEDDRGIKTVIPQRKKRKQSVKSQKEKGEQYTSNDKKIRHSRTNMGQFRSNNSGRITTDSNKISDIMIDSASDQYTENYQSDGHHNQSVHSIQYDAHENGKKFIPSETNSQNGGGKFVELPEQRGTLDLRELVNKQIVIGKNKLTNADQQIQSLQFANQASEVDPSLQQFKQLSSGVGGTYTMVPQDRIKRVKKPNNQSATIIKPSQKHSNSINFYNDNSQEKLPKDTQSSFQLNSFANNNLVGGTQSQSQGGSMDNISQIPTQFLPLQKQDTNSNYSNHSNNTGQNISVINYNNPTIQIKQEFSTPFLSHQQAAEFGDKALNMTNQPHLQQQQQHDPYAVDEEDSDFQNSLNFAKHRSPDKNKVAQQQAAIAKGGSMDNSNKVYQNASIMKNQMNRMGIHKASVVSQQTVLYDKTNGKSISAVKTDPNHSDLAEPTSLGELENIDLGDYVQNHKRTNFMKNHQNQKSEFNSTVLKKNLNIQQKQINRPHDNNERSRRSKTMENQHQTPMKNGNGVVDDNGGKNSGIYQNADNNGAASPPQHQHKLEQNQLQRRSKRKIIRRIVKKRNSDGSFVPVEITKTVIEKDGSRSITRQDPLKYASKAKLDLGADLDQDYLNGTINLSNQAPKDPYSNINKSRANDHRGGVTPEGQLQQMLSHQSTTYQTTAHRSSSGAIVLNRVATITTTQPPNAQKLEQKSRNQELDKLSSFESKESSKEKAHVTSKRKIKRIVVKKRGTGSETIMRKAENVGTMGNMLLLQSNQAATVGQHIRQGRLQDRQVNSASPAKLNKGSLEKIGNPVTEQELEYEHKRKELALKEKQMMQQFATLQQNVNAMNEKQAKMMKLQEVRQKQHSLQIQESKLQMLNSTQNAVNFMTNVSEGKGASMKSTVGKDNIDNLKQTIQKARESLDLEEVNIRDSIETFEKEFTKSQGQMAASSLNFGSFDMQARRSMRLDDHTHDSGNDEESKKNAVLNQSQGSKEHQQKRSQQGSNKNSNKALSQKSKGKKPQEQEKTQLLRKSFRIARADQQCFAQFIDDLLFSNDRKSAAMQPIPFGVGPLKFTIERNKSGFNKIYPAFTLYIEKPYGNKVTVLYAKKRAFNKTANFLISLSKTNNSRESNQALGKLRALETNDKFILYDSGENFSKLSTFKMSQVRTEHGYFMYRYEPCNVGNIRKMVIVLPDVAPVELIGDKKTKWEEGKDRPEMLYQFTAKNPKVKFEQKTWRPIKNSEQIQQVFLREGSNNENLNIFVDNPPQWNPKTNTYVYDFKGRVTQPSIKNFQLIPETDGKNGLTLTDFILQFGKNGKDSFILDVQFPFSVFQAFGLALSAFETE